MRDTDWMADALCAGHPNPDIFFPNEAGQAGRDQAREAALICRQCPVVEECHGHKKHTGAVGGVWAGTYTTLKEGVSPSAGGSMRNVVCGTDKGYRRHQDRGEKPCQACWSAHSRKQAPGGRSKRWSA